VQRAEVTSCNFRAPIATLGALGNPRELLMHPNCTQIFARPVNTRASVATNPTVDFRVNQELGLVLY